MPDDLDTPALQRLARDLRHIREDRGVSLASVRGEMQVHASHLKSFENGVLHEEARMNEVYLKAFVRAYAKAVGLPAETVVGHLESALSDAYDDQLAAAFLDAPPSAEGESDDTDAPVPDASEEEGDERADTADLPPASEDAPEAGESPSGPSPQDATAESTLDSSEDSSSEPPVDALSDQEETAPSLREEQSPPRKTEEVPKHFSDLPEKEETSGSSPRPPKGNGPSQTARPSEGSKAFVSTHRGKLLATVGILLFLALAGGLANYFVQDEGPSQASSGSEPVEAASASQADPPSAETPADTMASVQQRSRRAPAEITLGDTLYVTVRATADVRELRVQQDDNLRRPYWIEAGEARVFPFRERVTLQNQLDSLQLLLEGYRYPITSTDDQGRVIIRRDTAEQFADTLRGTPGSVPNAPDTIELREATPASDTLSVGPSDPEP
ncbi:helix-turn-helix domain-containing protein [Salinibacter altiplanensis]|uniref:helix-turn-helix domain-containing protein n=1 Tax=Salinibacter altiplanensis TaxID=1803181 RepID=UPI000C9F9181|nr:helix-turn-helix domain-containing protein [Salinibacter altiplanensis]